jgi:hypothetical protein
MTREEIKKLRELEEVALPPPWRQGSSTHRMVATLEPGSDYEVADFHHGHEQVFVCALRNAAQALLAAADMGLALGELMGHTEEWTAEDFARELMEPGAMKKERDKLLCDCAEKDALVEKLHKELAAGKNS